MAMASMAAVGWRWWCVLVVLCQHGDRLRERHTPSERTPSLPRMNHPKTAQLFGHVERGGSRPTGRTFSAEKHGLKYGPCHLQTSDPKKAIFAAISLPDTRGPTAH